VIRKETKGVIENAAREKLKIPDETFRNRNRAPEAATGAMSLRTKAENRGTASRTAAARLRVRPLGFFSPASGLSRSEIDPKNHP
jgi:hypothetical protein